MVMRSSDWIPMGSMDVDTAERVYHNTVFAILVRHIPRRRISEWKSVHPKINDRCDAVIAVKNASAGSDTPAAAPEK